MTEPETRERIASGLQAAYDLIVREFAESDPTTGHIVEREAVPTMAKIADAMQALSALPAQPKGEWRPPFSESMMRELSDREIRRAFVADQVRVRIALQVRALREQRGWSQEELGRRMDKPQSNIARIENPDIEGITLKTLLEIAAAFELPLLIDFAEWSAWAQAGTHIGATDLQRTSWASPPLPEPEGRT